MEEGNQDFVSETVAACFPPLNPLERIWRSTQSGANSSPPKFPANREKYREFARFCSRKRTHLSLSCTFCWGKWRVQRKSEQGPIRELTGRYQGIYFLIRDLLQNGVGLT